MSGAVARRGGAAVALATQDLTDVNKKTVMPVVITAVAGATLVQIRASSFCAIIAETLGMPAKIKLEKQYGL